MIGRALGSRAVRAGLRAPWRNLTPAIWTYVFGALASLPVALAGAFLVHERLSRSLSAGDFAARIDPVLVAELLSEQGEGVRGLLPVFIGTLAFWLAISTYLSGATLSAVTRSEGPRTGEFFAEGGRVFGRLLRLLCLAIPFVALVVGAPTFFLAKALKAITEDWISEQAVVAAKLSLALVVAIILAWASGASDLMRIEAVARGERRARYAFVRGLFRAGRHPVALLVVVTPFAVMSIGITIAFSLVDIEIGRSSWVAIAAGFVFQQGIAFARALLRVGLLAATVALVDGSAR